MGVWSQGESSVGGGTPVFLESQKSVKGRRVGWLESTPDVQGVEKIGPRRYPTSTTPNFHLQEII